MSKTVMISGGFDPIHPGHLELIAEACSLGTRVYVVIDSDEYVSSKHLLQQPQPDRAKIVSMIRGVLVVILGETSNGDCSDVLETHTPDVYLVGPDKEIEKLPEYEACQKLGIEIRKAQFPREKDWHSSKIIEPYKNPIVTVSGLIKFPGGKLLVAKRASTGQYELPGGFLEVGENLVQCLKREVEEETELQAVGPIIQFCSFPGKYVDGRDIISIYHTCLPYGIPQPTEECSEFEYWDRVQSENFFNECDLKAVKLFFGVDY